MAKVEKLNFGGVLGDIVSRMVAANPSIVKSGEGGSGSSSSDEGGSSSIVSKPRAKTVSAETQQADPESMLDDQSRGQGQGSVPQAEVIGSEAEQVSYDPESMLDDQSRGKGLADVISKQDSGEGGSSNAINPFTSEFGSGADERGFKSTEGRDFSDEAAEWLANSGLGYGTVVDLMGEGSYDDVKRFVQDNADWYASEFADGFNDDAFDAYWNKYKPTTIDDMLANNNMSLWFGTDENVIYDQLGRLYDQGFRASLNGFNDEDADRIAFINEGGTFADENGNETSVDANREAAISMLAAQYLADDMALVDSGVISPEEFQTRWNSNDVNALLREDYYEIGDGDDFGGVKLTEQFNNPDAYNMDAVFWRDPEKTSYVPGYAILDKFGSMTGDRYNVRRREGR